MQELVVLHQVGIQNLCMDSGCSEITGDLTMKKYKPDNSELRGWLVFAAIVAGIIIGLLVVAY